MLWKQQLHYGTNMFIRVLINHISKNIYIATLRYHRCRWSFDLLILHRYLDTLTPLPVAHQSQSVRWAAGDRRCSRPGTSRGPQSWWPSPSGPSSAPPGSRRHRAAPRSPQCEPSWGSQLRSLGCSEPSPGETVQEMLHWIMAKLKYYSCITAF